MGRLLGTIKPDKVLPCLCKTEDAGAALFRMVTKRAWKFLSKSIPHLTYPKHETIKKYNF